MTKTGKGNTFMQSTHMTTKTDASQQDGKEFAKYFEEKIVNQARGGAAVSEQQESLSL